MIETPKPVGETVTISASALREILAERDQALRVIESLTRALRAARPKRRTDRPE